MRRGEHSINLLFFKTPGVGLHPKSRETTSLKRNREIRRETRKRVRTETGGDFDFLFDLCLLYGKMLTEFRFCKKIESLKVRVGKLE